MSAPILQAVGEFQSFIRTGGEWTGGECSIRVEPCPYFSRNLCEHWTYGYYQGGTREPGRFTAKLAPLSGCPLAAPLARDRETITIPPSPRYDTPAEITKSAHARGTGALLPVKGEELGLKFLKALRATSPGWERNSAGPTVAGFCIECKTSNGNYPYLPIPHTCGKRKGSPRRKAVA